MSVCVYISVFIYTYICIYIHVTLSPMLIRGVWSSTSKNLYVSEKHRHGLFSGGFYLKCSLCIPIVSLEDFLFFNLLSYRNNTVWWSHLNLWSQLLSFNYILQWKVSKSKLGFLQFCKNRLGQIKEENPNHFLTEEKMQQEAGHYQTWDNQPGRQDKCFQCRKASAGAYSFLNSKVAQTHMNLLKSHAPHSGRIDIIIVMKDYLKKINICALYVHTHIYAQTHKYTFMYICRGRLWGFSPCSSHVAIKFMTIWSSSVNHSVLHHDRNTFVLETDNMKLASWHIKEKT